MNFKIIIFLILEFWNILKIWNFMKFNENWNFWNFLKILKFYESWNFFNFLKSSMISLIDDEVRVFQINIKLLSNPVAEIKVRENDSHCRSIDWVWGISKFVVPEILTIDHGFASVNSQGRGDNKLAIPEYTVYK